MAAVCYSRSNGVSDHRGGVTLVVGATGQLGGIVARLLCARGAPVRAFVRGESDHVKSLRSVGCEIVQGDLKDAASVAASCRGVTTVVVTANSMLSRRAGDSIATVDFEGVLRLVGLAEQAGVRALVYSSVSPTLPADNPFIRAKREVETALRSSRLGWTILQPSAFMEIHTGVIGGWHFSRGRARMAGHGLTAASFISTPDVASFIVWSVCAPGQTGRVLRVVGPEPLSPLDAVRIAERVTGRRFKVQRVPLGVIGAAAAVIGAFNPTVGSLLRMIRASDRPDVADMASVQDETGVRLTTFETYVRRMLAAGL